MKAIIIEDEKLSAEHLELLLARIDSSIEILGKYDSVKKSISALKQKTEADVIFLDIHLADGLSFDIFKEVQIDIPIIFTTAFDEYAIKAFELNSIDYLLKPIGKIELEQAIEKFKRLKTTDFSYLTQLVPLFESQKAQSYKSRFLVKLGENILSVQVSEINHFISEDGILLLVTSKGKRYPIDFSLDQLATLLDPNLFFRINRKVILHINSIEKISNYFNSRLKITSSFLDEESAVVSRERVVEFKQFLDQ